MAGSLHAKFVNLFCHLLRSQHFPGYFQCDHISIFLYILQDPFAFFVPDGIFYGVTCVIWCLFICHFHNLQFAVTTQTLAIFCNRIFQIFFFNLPYSYQCYFHQILHSYIFSDTIYYHSIRSEDKQTL